MAANGAEGDGLIDEEPELVLPLQLHHGLNVTDLPRVHVDALHHQETAGNFRLLRVLQFRKKENEARKFTYLFLRQESKYIE